MASKVPYSYLEDQFREIDPILASVKDLVHSTDFTLGKVLGEFEERFARVIGSSGCWCSCLPLALGCREGSSPYDETCRRSPLRGCGCTAAFGSVQFTRLPGAQAPNERSGVGWCGRPRQRRCGSDHY